jgi:hypothetical protein
LLIFRSDRRFPNFTKFMKTLFHRAAPSVTAIGLMLLPFGAQAASAPKSLEARLQEALGGASIVHLAAVSSPAEEGSATQLLSSSLPSGVSLKDASDAQMTEAVKAAVARDPKMAASIVRIAIVTKVPASERRQSAPAPSPRRLRPRSAPRGDGKSLSQNSTYNPWASAGVGGAQPRVFIAAVLTDPAAIDAFIYNTVFNAVSLAKGERDNIVRAAIGAAPAYAATITRAALAALADEPQSVRDAILGVAENAAPDQAETLAALRTETGLGIINTLISGLGANSLSPAALGAAGVNPANTGGTPTSPTTVIPTGN